MGAADFYTFERGATVAEAYSRAVDAARDEYGSGGYSGTIKEKSGYVLITSEVMTLAAAERLAQKLMAADDDRVSDKWGPAAAIPVVKGTRTITVNVAKGDLSDWRDAAKAVELASSLAKEQKLLRRGEKVTAASLRGYSTPDRGYRSWAASDQPFTDGSAECKVSAPWASTQREVTVSFAFDGAADWGNREEWEALAAAKVKRSATEHIVGGVITEQTPTFKVETDANAKVKAQTRYIVVGSQQHGTWENGFDSQAEARKYAVDNIARLQHFGAGEAAFEVVGVTKRADGTPLVKVTRTTTKSQCTVKVTVENRPPLPAGQGADGWLFFGYASS